MEVTDNTFFLVQVPGNKTLHQSEDAAIGHLQDQVKNLDPESDDVSVVRVSVDNDDWTIAEMSWQNIALRLMGD
jgi:hypothetical protein